MITFQVPGEPKGKKRKVTTKTGITFSPRDTVNYENFVRQCYLDRHQPRGDYLGPVEVHVKAFFSIPKSFSKKKTALAMMDKMFPTRVPDVDNIQKSVQDALNGIAWRDDRQIISAWIDKRYDKSPGLRITIYYTDEERRCTHADKQYGDRNNEDNNG